MKTVKVSRSKIRSFTSLYKGEAQRALLKTFEPIREKAKTTPPEALKRVVPHLVDDKHIQEMLHGLYKRVCVDFARDITKAINAKKDDQLEMFFSRYAYERSKKIAGNIKTTLEENINLTIDRVVENMTRGGASVVDIAQGLADELEGEFINIASWEAQRIAQTEVIGSANYGSFEGAKQSEVEGMQKAWITSGNANVRETHNYYQSLGAVEMDYEYNTGLQFPGDQNCDDPADVINCHCTIIYTFE